MRRLLPIAILLALVLLPAGPVRADDSFEARAFEVRYRPLVDAAELVGAVLSDEGRLTYKPRLKTLVVEDRPEVLERVAGLLEHWDLPPRNVEITMSLFLGSSRSDESSARRRGPGLSREVRGVLETLGDVTKWTDYETLGSRSITGAEGDTVVADLSDEFRVVIAVEAVHEEQGRIKFERFSLQRVSVENGTEHVRDLYTTGMLLAAGRLTVVGAARDPNSDRALFLTLQAEPR